MKNLSLDLPPGLFTDQQTQLLNERLRQIQDNLGVAVELRDDFDAAGKRIKNLGDSRDGADALNQRSADVRYPRQSGSGGGGGGGGETTTTVVSGSSDNALMFSVMGALAVEPGAAPLSMLATARSVREIVVLLQIATVSGPVILDLFVGETKYVSITIPQGAKQIKLSGAGLRPIPPNQVIRLDVVQVGKYPFTPGEGLTVLIRFV